MDGFDVRTELDKGTTVTLAKILPAAGRIMPQSRLRQIAHALAHRTEPNALSEVQRQNRELMIQLEELQQRQEQLALLNQELQDTNRGVVALYAELDERADHLRRADELKSRFLSNMSHEFRTPINSILSLTNLLLSRADGELAPEQEKQVQYVYKAADTLKELIDDLLDIAKVEAGKTIVTPKEFNVMDLFGTLRGMLRPLLVGNNVGLIFEDASDIPPLRTDEGKIAQILRNFISNAIKFTEKGEVRIWAELPADGMVSFHVRDTGIGIAEDHLELIWQEFSQVPHRLQASYKGTGLGLPLSKKLAELLGGSVSVHSAPGQGSLFSVAVPQAFILSTEPEVGPDLTIEHGKVPLLLVEDNPADAFSYERALVHTRYQIIHCRTLAEAKRALKEITPVAILLDVLLDNDETWGLLIEARHYEATASVPIIVISTSHEELKARQLGADEYLQKPVEPGELVRTLDELTGTSSVTRVLLVDDEEVSRYLVRQLLPRGTFELIEATTVYEGLASLATTHPDVILLDLGMPTVDGFEFLEKLPPVDENPPPAVVLSAMELNDAQRNRLGRASGFVSKAGLTSENLVAAIRGAVRPTAGQMHDGPG
jgi:signal transduction histidine kinase/CheY-like chemotaxis protein